MSRNSPEETPRWFILIAGVPVAIFGLLVVSLVPHRVASPLNAEASLASHSVRTAFVVYGACLIVGYSVLLANEWREWLARVRSSSASG